MKKYVIYLFLSSYAFLNAQENDTINVTIPDTMTIFNYQLHEVVVTRNGVYLSDEDKKAIEILKRRVLKVYPYAKAAAENLVMLNENMAKLKTEREKKRYFKIVENYLENEFEARLKKLSRKDGQILVKLIHRQTGETTFTLIKNLKSGWKAFWSNTTAKMFDINLKTAYDPFNVSEDFLIESMLLTAFTNKKLEQQKPAIEIDYKILGKTWKDRKKARQEAAKTTE